MLKYTVKRVALLFPLLLAIAVVAFGLLQLLPGDPVVVLLGENRSPAAVADLRQRLGLDDPLGIRLGRYLLGLARGDLGFSLFRHEPVARSVWSRLPATLELAAAGFLVSIGLGLVLGVASALKPNSLLDRASGLLAQLGVSMPVFWLGIVLMFFFAVHWNLLPAIGRGDPLLLALVAFATGHPESLVDALRHLALPSLTLGLNGAAVVSRLMRASLLDALEQDYLRAAKARGLSPARVVARHAFRNSLLPVVSVLGLRFGTLLGGAVLTESIFGWPGIGQLAVTALSQRDLAVVQGVVLVFAFLFALVTLGVDLLYCFLDPRIRWENA
jgi:peptide/nickel transport system permease protein